MGVKSQADENYDVLENVVQECVCFGNGHHSFRNLLCASTFLFNTTLVVNSIKVFHLPSLARGRVSSIN